MKDAVREFLRDPPAGSKTREAVAFGIDLTLTVRNMFTLNPAQRLDRLQQDQIDATGLRIATPRPTR